MTALATLGTGGVTLEPFAERHLTPRYVAWLNDPEVVRYSEQRHRRHTLESCRAYCRSFAGTPHKFWAIIAAPHGHVGNITATVDEPNRVADLAILVGERSVWGRGVGARAWTLALEWLLGPGGMRKVTAGTMAENMAMLAIMRKSGMAEEGRRRAQYLFDGRPVDAVLAARFAQSASQGSQE
ncbi:MAG TPA: GNAT family N-acetyltransferase [Alphaproteobacteria bacterium]|jgi:RimJ/RimL family protein N-acetyltransferase